MKNTSVTRMKMDRLEDARRREIIFIKAARSQCSRAYPGNNYMRGP